MLHLVHPLRTFISTRDYKPSYCLINQPTNLWNVADLYQCLCNTVYISNMNSRFFASQKETTMRELVQEREARLSLEKQLEGALAENKTCNDQLEALQGEIARLRSTSSSVDSLCDNVESCTRLQVRVERLHWKLCNRNLYHKGISIRQVPEFGTSKHHGKAPGISSGWMICNDTVCCWPITSSNIFIFDHIYSVKGGLKVFDCIVKSAEYWHPYGTPVTLSKPHSLRFTLRFDADNIWMCNIWTRSLSHFQSRVALGN